MFLVNKYCKKKFNFKGILNHDVKTRSTSGSAKNFKIGSQTDHI